MADDVFSNGYGAGFDSWDDPLKTYLIRGNCGLKIDINVDGDVPNKGVITTRGGTYFVWQLTGRANDVVV